MLFKKFMYPILALVLGLVLAFAPEEKVESAAAPGVPTADPLLAEAAAPPTPAPAVAPISETERLTSRALQVLRHAVVQQSHPEALEYAIEAYYNFRQQNPEKVRKPYFYFVDFGLPNTEARGYVFDMDALRLVEGPFTVAHGRGSARGAAAVPTSFSNRPGSNATSLGLFVAAETYGFHGTSGGRAYRSIGLRMDGVSGGFNSAARRRGVVVHGAPYVTPARAGRSEGCPAMEQERAQRLLPMLSGGSLIFLFSPLDREWMRLEPWIDEELAAVDQVPPVVSMR